MLHTIKTQAFRGLALTSLLCATPFVGEALAQKNVLKNPPVFAQASPERRVIYTLGVDTGYDDNVNTSKDFQQESLFTTVTAGLSASLGNSRTTLDINLSGAATYYWDNAVTDDTSYTSKLTVNLDTELAEGFRFYALGYAAYETEPNFTSLLGTNRREGQYFYGTLTLGIESQIAQRLSVDTSVSYATVAYDDTLQSDLYDRNEYGAAIALKYAVQPDLKLVLEYRYRAFDYDANRDSSSQYILAGLDYSANSVTTVGLRLGAELRDYDLTGSTENPYVEGYYNIILARQSSFNVNVRYGYEESDVAVAEQRAALRIAANFSQGLTPKLRLDLNAYYQNNDYGDTNVNFGFTEDVYSVGAGLSYTFSRNFQAYARYDFSTVSSDIASREYERNRYTLGLKFAF